MCFVVCSWSRTFNSVFVFSQGAMGKEGAQGLTGSPGIEVSIKHVSPTAPSSRTDLTSAHIIFITIFYLVCYPMKIRIILVLFPKNEPFVSTNGAVLIHACSHVAPPCFCSSPERQMTKVF